MDKICKNIKIKRGKYKEKYIYNIYIMYCDYMSDII